MKKLMLKNLLWHEMDDFLEKYNVSKLTEEETENLNNPVSNQDIEFVSKSFPQKKPLRPREVHGWILLLFLGQNSTNLAQTSSEIGGEGKHCWTYLVSST